MAGPWRGWLVAWCWSVIVVGFLLLAVVVPPLSAPTRLYIDMAFWPMDGQPVVSARETLFSLGILGAVTVGWGVLMLGLVTSPGLAALPAAWRWATGALAVWFAGLCLASWAAGAPTNMLSGANLFLTWLYPVWRGGFLRRGAVEGDAAPPMPTH
jgi:hypothetical protein